MILSEHVEQLFLRDASSGRWHTALVEGDKEPMVYDACNVTGEREYFHTMPDDVADALLCKRCFDNEPADQANSIGAESQNDADQH